MDIPDDILDAADDGDPDALAEVIERTAAGAERGDRDALALHGFALLDLAFLDEDTVDADALARGREALDRGAQQDPDLYIPYARSFELEYRRSGDEDALATAVATLEHAHQAGQPDVANLLGNLLVDVGRDDEGHAWYRRGIEQGDGWSAFNLGTILWQQGEDLDEAEWMLRLAAEQDVGGAYHNLGQLLVHSDDVARQVEGERVLRRGAEEGHAGCLFALSGVLADDPGRVDEAEEILRDLVDQGYPDPLNDLGLLLWNRRTPESIDEAESLYRRALEIDPDDRVVLLNLGVLLRHKGVEDEVACKESREMSRRAAELGDLKARFNLGNWYNDHDQPDEAAEHYRLAADEGHVEAHTSLGILLVAKGEVDEAERCYRYAAEHGDAMAMNNLGVLLLRRDGDDARDEAFGLFERSAEGGDPHGMAAKGKVFYQQGRLDQAREWLRRAAAEGSERAAELLRLWDAGDTSALEGWGKQ